MFRICCLLLILISAQSFAERRTGRNPAIVLEPKQILKELKAGTVGEAKEIIKKILSTEEVDSASRNKAILYRDSLNSLSSAPVRQSIYHGDTSGKYFNRFMTRLRKGFTLKTVLELTFFGFLFSGFVFLRKKKKNINKAKFFHVTEELFTLQTFQLLKKKLGRNEYFKLKRIIKEVVDEINFLVDFEEEVLIDYHFNKSRFLLIFNFPVELNSSENRNLVEAITPILNSITPRYYLGNTLSKEFVISLNLKNLSLQKDSGTSL